MLLIRNGLIHTMTAAGSIRGDILADQGRILRVGEHIETQAEEIIDATGLQVCPGLIDAHMHMVRASDDDRKNEHDLCADALSSGVTTQGIWPEDGGQCRIYHGHAHAEAPREPMRCRNVEGLSDSGLKRLMEATAAAGERLACEVYGEELLMRLLRLKQETGCKLVLTHLTGCDAVAEDVAASGCEVIMGACVLRSGSSSFAMAAQLAKAGVCVALTSDYPATRLHHLPLTAGLCVRSGMDHQDALKAITLNAARILRVDDVCGAIEPGKRADLTLFDGDPLMLATARIMTVSGGEIVQKS